MSTWTQEVLLWWWQNGVVAPSLSVSFSSPCYSSSSSSSSSSPSSSSTHQHKRVKLSSLSPPFNKDCGAGLYATRPLAPHEPFASIPSFLVFDELHCRRSPFGRYLMTLSTRRSMSTRTLMWLCMCHEREERERGESAFFGPYFRSLPRAFDTPLYWQESELLLLKGTALYDVVLLKREQMSRRWHNVVPCIRDESMRAALTRENFLWAMTAYTSRGFPHRLSSCKQPHKPSVTALAGANTIDTYEQSNMNEEHNKCPSFLDSTVKAESTAVDGLRDRVVYHSSAGIMRTIDAENATPAPVGCMLPFLDLTNHHHKTAITWTAVPFGEEHPHDQLACTLSALPQATQDETFADMSSARTQPDQHHPGRVVFALNTGVEAGEQVMNNYGAKSNTEFLLGYGFCLQNNEFDELTLQVSGLSIETAHILSEKNVLWRNYGFYLSRRGIPENLLQVLRVAVMAQSELARWHASSLLTDTAVACLEMISDRNEFAAYVQLRALLLVRLCKMGHSSIDRAQIAQKQDENRICSLSEFSKLTAPQRHQKLALIYRTGQRGLLVHGIEQVEERLVDLYHQCVVLKQHRVVCFFKQNNVDDCSDPLLIRYRTWIANNGIEAVCDLASSTTTATRKLSQLGKSLSLPIRTCISLQACSSFQEIVEMVSGLTEQQLMAMLILHEFNKGEQSEWHAFLQAAYVYCLPPWQHCPETPVPLPLRLVVEEHLVDESEVYDQLFPALSNQRPDLFSTSLYTLCNWRWALYLSCTRLLQLPAENNGSFSLPWCILPLLRLPILAQQAGNIVSLEDSHIVLRSLRNYSPGEKMSLLWLSNNSVSLSDSSTRFVLDGIWCTPDGKGSRTVTLTIKEVFTHIEHLCDKAVHGLLSFIQPGAESPFIIDDRGVSPALFAAAAFVGISPQECDTILESIDNVQPHIALHHSRNVGASGRLDSDEEEEEMEPDLRIEDIHNEDVHQSINTTLTYDEQEESVSIFKVYRQLAGSLLPRATIAWTQLSIALVRICAERVAEIDSSKDCQTHDKEVAIDCVEGIRACISWLSSRTVPNTS